MSISTEERTDLIKRCSDLEHRFVALQKEGRNCSIAIRWARQWANDMLDSKQPTAIYTDWIEQQEKRADRLESKTQACDHNYAYTSGIGMGCVVYRCILCGDSYEKDVS